MIWFSFAPSAERVTSPSFSTVRISAEIALDFRLFDRHTLFAGALLDRFQGLDDPVGQPPQTRLAVLVADPSGQFAPSFALRPLGDRLNGPSRGRSQPLKAWGCTIVKLTQRKPSDRGLVCHGNLSKI